MAEPAREALAAQVAQVYREQSRRILATLIRLLGDFDLAEEALHDAFFVAVERWQDAGVPDNPRAWLVSVGRFKGIDALRRRARFAASQAALLSQLEQLEQDDWSVEDVQDDRLRLIFTCCHPALAADAQVPLTLREICDLSTEEIARAFLVSPATIAQRIVRAKAKIRDAGIPYQVPELSELPERLGSVLRVIYLVFNEGYSASMGAELTRDELTREAIRLGYLLLELLPEAEVMGLLALMLLHESRRTARISATGELILLDEQDRSLWQQDMIEEGCALVERGLRSGHAGPYCLQAAIAAVHAEAASAEQTDWAQIVGLYDILLRLQPSPVIRLNRAVALAQRDGPAAGLAQVEAILSRGDLQDYHLAHAARADFCRQLGQVSAARESYQLALTLARQGPEQRFLEQRLAQLDAL
ncbi:sigma-70 family RNA polymerase sigma factor [Pseudomonas sp. 3MA1]|uniref:RNA polymerase sigma factor n=1 Tax=Pseudomonas sp. 3MA1 TaxID=2699196 RepID=UPI0023DE13E4|nr:RNA polymerase sigma factor [Pseudomonas sp. 3MA1]MDF2398500.1 sigma-70 family RNA polymerase sigma factor [Pseudomonas sp. 3MA1]